MENIAKKTVRSNRNVMRSGCGGGMMRARTEEFREQPWALDLEG